MTLSKIRGSALRVTFDQKNFIFTSTKGCRSNSVVFSRLAQQFRCQFEQNCKCSPMTGNFGSKKHPFFTNRPIFSMQRKLFWLIRSSQNFEITRTYTSFPFYLWPFLLPAIKTLGASLSGTSLNMESQNLKKSLFSKKNFFFLFY